MYSKSLFPLAVLAFKARTAPVVSLAPADQGLAVQPKRRLHPAYATRPRGKGKQAKPAKRSNRLHISRRTRRKHRRAA